jgi:hypothetical protein
MISDTLRQSHSEISEYLKEFPETYAEMLPEITALLAEMERIRIILDTPPSVEPHLYSKPTGRDGR